MLILKTSAEFQLVAKIGTRWNTPAFILQVLKKPDAPFRVGFTASRKVGNAVIRNRAKRRLREIVCLMPPDLKNADIVLIAKTAAAEYDFKRLQEDLIKGLKATKVME
jgi:ribonuclease P protein component